MSYCRLSKFPANFLGNGYAHKTYLGYTHTKNAWKKLLDILYRLARRLTLHCAEMSGIFFYVTYKLVVLKDSRLGLLYYVLALLALLFTVIEIFVKKGYLEVNILNVRGTCKTHFCWR